MWSFLFFNWGLPTLDVVTDLANFVNLRPHHPGWACLTLIWMFTSFVVHALLFIAKRIKAWWYGNTCNTCQTCITCDTWKRLGRDFYKEAVIHFPGIATFHNLWKAWRLYKLKWGTKDFKTENHKQVVDKQGSSQILIYNAV